MNELAELPNIIVSLQVHAWTLRMTASGSTRLWDNSVGGITLNDDTYDVAHTHA